MDNSEIIGLERGGWRALASGAQAATRFYERVLDDNVIMLLPGGLVLDDRAMILKSMTGPPWSTGDLTDWRVLHPTRNTAVVTYTAVAARTGADPYSALMSSVYVRRSDGWRLAFHQTPRG